MKPQTIGIIGGAGPLAGAFLLQRVLRIAQEAYGCSRDEDFPKVLFVNFPFSDMLTEGSNVQHVEKELNTCLNDLRTSGAHVIAIACNTLHIFLKDASDVVYLPKMIGDASNALVLCSSTSVRYKLHRPYAQLEVDEIIDLILKGEEEKALILLREVILAQSAKTIILGCTELSLLAGELKGLNKTIIDPLEITANKLVEKSFYVNK